LTRNFIEDALTRATKSLKRDEKVTIEAVLDRDTAGVAGTPGIAETILQKIDECDVFVCDVSIINGSQEVSQANLLLRMVRAVAQVILEGTFKYRRIKRLTPNPNVLIELGYAAARIGWQRVILVQNTAFGDPGSLPFDLRNRRIVPFNLSAKEAGPDERQRLGDKLELALGAALADVLTPTFWVAERKPRWFGLWRAESGPTRGGKLFIREVGASGFIFHLSLFDGARSGAVTGFAGFTGPDSAHARIIVAEDREPCQLKFRRSMGEARQIRVEESLGCNYYKGMGASFDGIYTLERDLLFESGALDEIDRQRLYSITGKYYWPLVERFQQIGKPDNLDVFPATVTSGGAKGLYTLYAGIVMKGREGQLWAAYVDSGPDLATVIMKRFELDVKAFGADVPAAPPTVVRYFTTEREFKKRLPKTIEAWRERFSDKEVIFANEFDTIPSF
jgi:hypothetical protein